MSKNLIIAENINTPAEQLRELADTEDDKAILAAIARNPNTPIDLLIELASKYLDEIGQNPALELILIEHPNFIADIYYELDDDKICSETFLPEWFIKLGSNHSESNIRYFIAINKSTSASYLQQLANDKNSYVRRGVAKNENIPVCVLEQLAKDEHKFVKKEIIKNPNTPISILEQLAPEVEDILKEDSAALKAINLRSFNLSESGNNRAALRIVNLAINLNPNKDFSYFVLSIVLTNCDRLNRAKRAIKKAIKINPHKSIYYVRLSNIFRRQKKWHQSLIAAEQGQKLDPESLACLHNRAIALSGKGRSKEAKAIVKKALKIDEKYYYSWVILGWILLDLGEKPEKALIYFKRALAINPNCLTAKKGILTAIKAKNLCYRKLIMPVKLWKHKVNSSTYSYTRFLGIVCCGILLALSRSSNSVMFHWAIIFFCLSFLLIVMLGEDISNVFVWKEKQQLLEQRTEKRRDPKIYLDYMDLILPVIKLSFIVWIVTRMIQPLLIAANIAMSLIAVLLILDTFQKQKRIFGIVLSTYSIIAIAIGSVICIRALIETSFASPYLIFFFLVALFGMIKLKNLEKQL